MHRRPRDCNPSQINVHNAATPHQRARPLHTNRTIPTQTQRLGMQARRRTDVDQSTPPYPRGIPTTPNFGNSHIGTRGVRTKYQLAGLTRNEESTNNTADTIADTITTHMAKLSKMTTASNNKHSTQTNASLQQLAAKTNQLHQQQQDIINQIWR